MKEFLQVSAEAEQIQIYVKKSQLAFPHAMSVAVHIKHVADGVYILLH